MKQYKEVISASHDYYGKVTNNTECSEKVKLIMWNGQVAYCGCKSAISIFIHSLALYMRLLFENALKLAANHF